MSTLCTSKIAYLYELKALCRIKILNVFQITKGTLRSARKEDAVATIPFFQSKILLLLDHQLLLLKQKRRNWSSITYTCS